MSIDLAKLVARLELQSSQFQSELEKANKKLSSFGSEAEKKLKKISSGFKGALAGIGVGFSFGALISATAEAEAAQAKLENAVRNNGGAAGFTSKQLIEMSGELQKVTTFSDDAVQGMQSLLLRFRGLSGPEFDRAQRAVLDLSTALGVDLNTAAKTVGKALEDPEKGANALARMGVRLSDSQKKLVKDFNDTGQKAKAQAVILTELEARYGGAAEAARNTFGGALAGLKNAFGDLLEAKSGLPGVTSAINDLTKTLESEDTKAAADSFGSAMLVSLSAIGKAAAQAIKPVSKFILLANDLGAKLDNKIFGRQFTESEMNRMFGVQSSAPSHRGNTPLPPVKAGPDPAAGDEKALESLKKLTDGLRQQIATYEQGAVATIKYRIAQGDLSDEFKKAGAAADPLRSQLIGLTAQYEELQKVTKQKEAAKELAEMTTALSDQVAVYGMGETATMRFRVEQGDLAKTFAEAGAAADPYKQQLIDLTARLEEMSKATAKQAELDKQMEAAMSRGAAITEAMRTPQEQYAATIGELNDLLALGVIQHDAYGKAVLAAQEKLVEATDKWTVFKDQAARNTQDIIADTLTNGFDKGVNGILKSFGEMIKQLVAQAIAADIAGKLFGKAGGGEGGGWISAIASMFAGASGRAMGGPVTAGTPYRVNENTPNSEWFVPSQNGKVVPAGRMGGGGLTVNFALPPGANPASMETQTQVANRMAAALAASRRRNG